MLNRLFLFVVTFAVGAVPLVQLSHPADKVTTRDISGLALLSQDATGTQLVVVHDDKKVNDGVVGPRCGIVSVPRDGGTPTYRGLRWEGAVSKDLEGIVRVPGTSNEFLAIGGGAADNDEGTLYRLRIDPAANVATVRKTNDEIVKKKVKDADYEAVALYQEKGKTAIMWADRGGSGRSAKLYWGDFDLGSNRIKDVGSVKFQSPWPTGNDARSASDLKIDEAGNLYVSAASDPGDTGPFASAVYVIGNIRRHDDGWIVRLSGNPVMVRRIPDHKVEALELVPGADGGLWVGTDDESFGGYLIRD